MKKVILLILLILIILLILWLLGICPRPPVDPDPDPGECVGVQTYTRTPALSIPEALPPGPGTPQPVTDTMEITDTGTVGDLNIVVSAQLPEHGELILDLTSPSGTTVRFLNTEGGPGDGLQSVRFDDEAAAPPPSFVVNGTCWINDNFQPAPDALSAFDGEPINGTWTLTVADAFVGDAVDCDCDGFTVGPACPRTLDEWTLEIDCDSDEVDSLVR